MSLDLLFSCRHNIRVKTCSIPVIEIAQNLGKYKALPLSEFVTELEYTPLETSDDCLIGEWDGGFNHIIVTTSYIFVAGYRFCYAFDRNGRFLCEIGRIGQGPGEYQYMRGLSIDENKKSLYIDAVYSILEYSYDGVFRRSIKIPQTQLKVNDRLESYSMNNVYLVRNNLFIGHTDNPMGNAKYTFQLINDSAQVVESFDNHVQFNRTKAFFSSSERAMRPYRVLENIYVKEVPNDTIYCLNVNNELISQFVFNLGQYAYNVKDREDAGVNNPSSQIPHILQLKVIFVPYIPIPMVGTHNFIFFSYEARNLSEKYTFPKRNVSPPPVGVQNFIETDSKSHLGIYDIINQRTQLLDTDPVLRRRGLINDLDGGLPFWPKYYSSANELVDVWQAYEMKEYLTDTYFAAQEIKNPFAYQKLKELLKRLNEEDNPVIIIANLKK